MLRAILAKLRSFFNSIPLVDGDPLDEIDENFPAIEPIPGCICSICRNARQVKNAE